MCCCVASESVSGKDGGSVPLKTNVTKGQHDIILWSFNGILIARINANASDSCLYDGKGGRFRDRLEVDYETGSLTIKNITAEHTGQYEADIIKSGSSGTRERLNRTSKCDSNKVTPKTNNMGKTKTYNVSVIGAEKARESTEEEQNDSVKDSGLSPGAVAGICAGVAVLAAVGAVIYCRQQRDKRGNKEHNMSEFQKLKSSPPAGPDVP